MLFKFNPLLGEKSTVNVNTDSYRPNLLRKRQLLRRGESLLEKLLQV